MARTLTAIDLDGVVTLSSDVMEGAKTIQVLCTQTSGTSDGTIGLYGSLDGTNYQLLNFVGARIGTASPVASLSGASLNLITITAGLVASWVVDPTLYPYTKLTAVGTASDRTAITGSWSK